jgi:glycosyltransferase involved in cell wall biosynthesis
LKKIDLVMWTKNGGKTLPYVLKRIREVVPSKNVGNRIIVDDSSVDQTCQIAEQLRTRGSASAMELTLH